MSRQVVLTQAEAASSRCSFEPGVLENFILAKAFNKIIDTEQKFPKVSAAKGTIFELVEVPLAIASSWQQLYFLSLVLVARKMWLSTIV